MHPNHDPTLKGRKIKILYIKIFICNVPAGCNLKTIVLGRTLARKKWFLKINRAQSDTHLSSLLVVLWLHFFFAEFFESLIISWHSSGVLENTDVSSSSSCPSHVTTFYYVFVRGYVKERKTNFVLFYLNKFLNEYGQIKSKCKLD